MGGRIIGQEGKLSGGIQAEVLKPMIGGRKITILMY